MAASRWTFTKEQLQNTPSRKSGMDADKELSYRQQGANLIQDMGQRLSVTQLCINTAIVYLHRFYMFQSFTRFQRNEMATAALFLAAKVEEQPRKLEHVIKVAHSCLCRDKTPAPDTRSEAYLEQAQQLVINENILLQTLGFEVTVDHPHTHIVKATNLVKASKDLAQTSYFLATNSLHMTTFCLQYRPTIVACVCIYLACKWSNWKIPRSNEGREWFQYVDRSVTSELLEDLYTEFIAILEKYPHKLRKKIMGWKGDKDGNVREEECVLTLEQHPKKLRLEALSTLSSSSQDSSRPPPSSTQHKHTNHDRKDAQNPKDSRSDTKLAHDHRKHNMGHERKDMNTDRKPGAGERKDTSGTSARVDRKELHGEGAEKLHRKDGHSERKDPQFQQRKEPHPERREHTEKKPAHFDHRDSAPVKKESNTEVRSQTSSNVLQTDSQKPKVEFEIGSDSIDASVRKESSQIIPHPAHVVSSAAIQSGEMRKVKSDLSINYKDYLKRKEQEKLERERVEKERIEKERREKQERDNILKQKIENEVLNKTFTEGSDRERKHRPPKLDISLPLPGSSGEHRSSDRDHNERPYEVNIKSPVKPHYNITVKSPIKSSDLKRPRLEITKVHLAPDKDGGDTCSVNINSVPIKKIIENTGIKQEPGVSNVKGSSHESVESPRHKVKTEPTDHTLKIKRDKSEVRVKQEPLNSQEADIDLNPEHSAAPMFKIKELGHDPHNGNSDTPGSLKMSIKQEHGGSGRSTPVVNQVKSESGSGSNTPIRHKIVIPSPAENSPLKLKISTKVLPQDPELNPEKHRSPHRHHKHKDKHKSHKHSRDREKHREKHRDKHGSGSSGTNGHPLKMSIKLSDIQGHSSSSNESWTIKHKDKHRHKASVSDPALNRNVNSEAERQQPWSMTDLLSKSAAGQGTSPARKRRRTPNVEVNNDISHPKAAKTDTHSHRLRRSSSSHSVVSMEMSDGEEGHGNEGVIDQPRVVNQLQESLQQMIDQTKRNVLALQQQQQHKKPHRSVSNSQQSRRPAVIDRQQSGFDLEGMMWSSGASDPPPLPPEAPPPLPKHPHFPEVPPPPPE